MMTPATASTGTTLFTPISGASAAVRITPVPKPPMPPTTAAARPSAATAASVYASSSNLALDGPGPAVAIDCDVGERCLGDLYDGGIRRPALGEDFYLHRDRGIADAHDL